MAHEKNPSVFGKFGNRGAQFTDNPTPVPLTRAFLDYADRRHHTTIPPTNVFAKPGAVSEPQVYAIPLDNAQADVIYQFNGNFIWLQSSTNTTDTLTIKFERTSATGIPFLPGNMIRGIPYSKLLISNASIPGAVAFLILMQSDPAQPIDVL